MKRLDVYLEDSGPLAYSWVLILFEIPILSRSLVLNNPKLKLMSDVPEIKMLSYDILKRCLGILSCIDNAKTRVLYELAFQVGQCRFYTQSRFDKSLHYVSIEEILLLGQ